ncbi:DLL1-like protein, partial [Mya arenaria]
MFARLTLVCFLHVFKVEALNTSCCDSYHVKRQNGELWTCGNCPPGYHFVDDCDFNGGRAKCSSCSEATAEGDTKCVRCPEGTISPNNSSEEKCMPDTDDCALMPCMNNGTCTDLVDDFKCTCPGGISGRRCEHATSCDNGPCQNGGRCVPEGILHICDCPDGFKGKNCEETIPSSKCA